MFLSLVGEAPIKVIYSEIPWVAVFMEALIKSTRAVVERFFGGLRFEKRRNTLCISSFSNRKADEKDPATAAGDLFRDSLNNDNGGINMAISYQSIGQECVTVNLSGTIPEGVPCTLISASLVKKSAANDNFCGVLLDFGADEAVLEKAFSALDAQELRTLKRAMSEKAAALFPAKPQLPAGEPRPSGRDADYMI